MSAFVFGVRNKIILLLLLLSLVPIILLSIIFYNKIQDTQKTILLNKFSTNLNIIDGYINSVDLEIVKKTKILASNSAMQEVLANDSSGVIKQLIDTTKSETSMFSDLVVLSDKNIILATTSNNLNDYVKDIASPILDHEPMIKSFVIGNNVMLRLSVAITASYNQNTCIGYLVVFVNNNFLTESIAKLKINDSAQDAEHILVVIDNSTDKLIYSNTNLINNYNLKILSPVNSLTPIKLGNNYFIFSKNTATSKQVLKFDIYVGLTESEAVKNINSLDKLFKITLPIAILVILLLVYLSAEYLNKAINCKKIGIQNSSATLPSIEFINTVQNIINTINQISHKLSDNTQNSIKQINDSKYIAHDILSKTKLLANGCDFNNEAYQSIETIKKAIDQINILSLNTKIEVAKAGISGEVIVELISEVKQATKQALDSANNIEKFMKELKLNSDKKNLNVQDFAGNVQTLSDLSLSLYQLFTDQQTELDKISVQAELALAKIGEIVAK